MRIPRDETLLVSVDGCRKGNSYRGTDAPCEVGVTILENPDGSKTKVLRALDKSGKASIVIKLSTQSARTLANALHFDID